MDSSVCLVEGFLSAPLLLVVQVAYAPLPLPRRFYGPSNGNVPPVVFTHWSWDSGQLTEFYGIGTFAGNGIRLRSLSSFVRYGLAVPVASTPWSGWHWCPLAGAEGQVPPCGGTPALHLVCGFVSTCLASSAPCEVELAASGFEPLLCTTMQQWFSV